MGSQRHDCFIVLAKVRLVNGVQSSADLAKVPQFDGSIMAARDKLKARFVQSERRNVGSVGFGDRVSYLV